MSLSGDEVGKVENFKYLGSVLQKNGGFEEHMQHMTKGYQLG